ncbi:PaaI family thioesterase [Ferrimonas lipolytica]|uniref:PaaI family thioesterase n=1 Tax=Ferrimonas lipolytica TaxID=2724191 RepID=A0A6H1UAN6_9GAMM|nr:PaaI family thioesterase [Ferrimonas lipolytica]QIZ76125.1 PaaI family thioesterase [Ferrimonas lipolytica]
MALPNRGEIPLTGYAQRFVDQLAQCRTLGIRTVEASERHIILELPYQTRIIGYPDTGVIHGGVITTLADTACGAVVVCALRHATGNVELSPTLDLRVDYMMAAKPEQPVFCYAECHKLTSAIAFVRAIVYQDDINNPVAQAVGSFMRIGPELVTEQFRKDMEGG